MSDPDTAPAYTGSRWWHVTEADGADWWSDDEAIVDQAVHVGDLVEGPFVPQWAADSEWARRCGIAEGALEASQWPGVIDGWRDKATRLRDAGDRLADFLALWEPEPAVREDAAQLVAAWRALTNETEA